MSKESPSRANVNRRTILQGAAWSVPVIAVAVGAPAAAASPREYSLTPNGRAFSSVRCGTVAAGTVTLTARLKSGFAPVSTAVTITLPEGLRFATGAPQTATALVEANGVVKVPAFVATGAAGNYSIMASIMGQPDVNVFGTVTPSPGQVYQLTRSITNGTTAPAVTAAIVAGLTQGTLGAISGGRISNDTEKENGAVINGGDRSVSYFGSNMAANPAKLRYNGADLIGIRFIDNWSAMPAGNATTGGVVAGADANSVYQWHASNNAPNVARVTGIEAGATIIAAQSNDGFSYALTSAGLYWWPNATSGSTVAASLVAGTRGAQQFGSWSRRAGNGALSYGGSVLLSNGTVSFWLDSHTTTAFPALPAGAGTIRKLESARSATYALTTSGRLYTYGAAFSLSGGATTWSLRASDVADFNSWSIFNGRNHYTGGLYISADGTMQQFFAADNEQVNAYKALPPVGTDANGVTITKVFSSDGTYLALAADNRVLAWGGNLDTTRSPARFMAGVTAAIDLNVWGFHSPDEAPNDKFYGGGYIITSPACA